MPVNESTYSIFIIYILFGYLRNDVEPHPATNGTDLTNLFALWCDKMGRQIGWINSI